MHFFHPIQQCAQQVYLTALPLSPPSSYLQKFCLQNVVDNQLSHVTAFVGAPSTWGLLLRAIDTRPRQLMCITTSGQQIIAVCEDIVNIYNAVTGVLQQSLSPSETVTKIQASPDGSTLFFAHSSSVTMWDVQTGGLIHTFTTQPTVNDIAVSASGDHIACGLSNGSVRFWNVCTKVEGGGSGNGQSVVTTCWLSPQKLAVATQNSLYICDAATGKTIDNLSILDDVWGMIYLADKEEFLVGTSSRVDRELCSLETISHRYPEPLEKRQPTVNRGRLVRRKLYRGKQSPTHPRQLTSPTLVGKEIVCVTPPIGVQPFDTISYDWTSSPPLLDAAISVAVSLNRNLVAQTKDFIKIFSTDVLASGETRSDTRVSHVYSLGEDYIICVVQPIRRIAILELETLREVRRDDETLPFWSLPPDETKFDHTISNPFDQKFEILKAMRAWWSDTSLHERVELPDEDTPRLLYGLSPAYTKIAILHAESTQMKIWVNDAKHGGLLASLPLKSPHLIGEEVYDLIFDSETSISLKIYGPGLQHVSILLDITPSSSSGLSHTITRREPIYLSKRRATPPYILDANCEWVLDAQSRKICWITPGNLRKGNGGHFWAGLSLVMVGDDGVVRKISFKEPDC
jgi:hypothetical protein